jgi:hypothetical protein
MKVPFCGGCACGAIRYQCSAEPIMAVNCHCRDCQRATGTAYASGLFVPGAALRITKGDPKYHTTTADSGNLSSRGFCRECGSPVLANSSGHPMVIIYASSLDDPSWHQPTMDVFASKAQPWDYMNPSLPRYSQGLGS